MDADMIGYEVENQTEIVLFQCCAEFCKAIFTAKLRIELGVIGDVVTMRRALARLHERRGVEVADAERLQIRHDARGRFKVEIRGELQAIGGDRNGRRHGYPPMLQNTDQGGRRSPGMPPQIDVPQSRGGDAVSSSERLASKRNVVPSPSVQCAVRTASVTSDLPNCAPGSRGARCLCLMARRLRTS